ncbi:MAG: substrate-binding domain-containing protein [Oscillospiraceae bacterium]|nr:substrate-binding domain-containing protein [Oscillospiraceae bacterium]
MKKIVAILLSLALGLAFLAACEEAPGNTGGVGEEEAREQSLFDLPISVYTHAEHHAVHYMFNEAVDLTDAQSGMSLITDKAVIIIEGGGSGVGEQGALDGMFDIGMVHREVNPDYGLESATVAIDALAIIVNHANPLTNISTEDLRALYLGEFNTWADLP